MAKIITEDMIEKATIEELHNLQEYNVLNCMTSDPEDLNDNSERMNKKQVVLPKVLWESLKRLNPQIPDEILSEVAKELSATNSLTELMTTNYNNYNKLRNKIQVEYQRDGKKIIDFVQLIAFNNPEMNDFTVCSQFWIKGQTYFRRPDLIIFINGLPMIFIELKNSDISVKTAYDKNLTDYLRDIPQLFYWNQFCVLSNSLETRVGSFEAGYEHFFEWLKVESEKENPNREQIKKEGISLRYLMQGLLNQEKLLDYIENFIIYEDKKTKIIAKNHQLLGVNNAVENFKKRDELDGKLGVFWHTQGSGKSYSMVFFTKKIIRKYVGNYTFLMITDRDDLNGQLFKNFVRTGVVSEKDEAQPKSSQQLREFLNTNKPFIFTLIHKFRYPKGKKYPLLSKRDDIIVLVDEAHRTQYKDLAENMRAGIPNAQFVAFTGTPLLGNKRLTNQWFGDYVSEYNFAQSIEDGATVPLYYSKRVPEVKLININLDNDFVDIIEKENLTDDEQWRLERQYSNEMEVLKRDDRLEMVARDIVYHFPRRGYLGKGMVISVDKFTAVKMYDKVQYHWKEEIKRLNKQIMEEPVCEKRQKLKRLVDYMNQIQMAVVISKEDGEEKKFAKQGLDISLHRSRMELIDDNGYDIEDNFKDSEHPLSLVFVCAMWLTGFDVPSVSTIYLDKPMKGHTLMQGIARANRVFPGKTSGLIVDYLNIFKNMKKALGQYAVPSDDATMPIKAIENLIELLDQTLGQCVEFCLLVKVDLTILLHADATFDKLDIFKEFANKILANDETKSQFKIYSNLSDNLYEASKPEIFDKDWDNSMLQVVLYLAGIINGTIRSEKVENAKLHMDHILDQSVESLLKVKDSPGAYELESTKAINLAKLDIEALKTKINNSPYKNIEISDLRIFIEEKLHQMLNVNVTRTKFSEMYKCIIDRYNAGGSENENFYEELLEFVKKMQEEEKRHVRENMSEEELELFDLLKKENLTKTEEEQVKLSAKQLYETLTKSENHLLIIDWYKDEQPKQKVQSAIQNILNRHLPQSYSRLIFQQKTDLVFNHIVDKATTGYSYMAS